MLLSLLSEAMVGGGNDWLKANPLHRLTGGKLETNTNVGEQLAASKMLENIISESEVGGLTAPNRQKFSEVS